ncbi:MAG TPA: glycosyltransferase family 4 protein [Xanthobacteraceae bacterium]|nr:glycosyltransferase family 4 protein [Xanthobacteraceae bacterium]
MRKILYLVTEDWFFVSHFLPMAQAARDCGLQVVVATRVRADGERLKAEGFSVIAIEGRRGSFSPWRSLRDFFQAFKIVRAERADIVHCIALRPVVIGGVAAKLAGTKALVLAPTGLGHLWIERGVTVRFARKIVSLIVGSWLRGPRTRYLFENRDDPGEFAMDPDGADVSIVGGAGVEPAKFPRSEEPVAPPVKVAVVSRMIRPKGVVESVDAARRARAAGAPIELHLFGDPDPDNPRSIPRATLEQWSKEPGIAWHGHDTDVARVWREHHVAMLLSYREGLPRSLVEAAAAGRPIVATDVPGCREVVRDGKEGILVPLGDTEAAGRALATLAADPALRRRLGAAANARFNERFTAAAVRETVRNLYRSLVPPL